MSAEREALRELAGRIDEYLASPNLYKQVVGVEHALRNAHRVLAEPPTPDAAAPLLEGAAARVVADWEALLAWQRREFPPDIHYPSSEARDLDRAMRRSVAALEAALRGEREGRGA